MHAPLLAPTIPQTVSTAAYKYTTDFSLAGGLLPAASLDAQPATAASYKLLSHSCAQGI